MQQAHFQHVVNPQEHFREIERLADEILRSGFQCAYLVVGLGGLHENRKIAAGFHGLQSLHDLESIQAGHLKVEQDQGIGGLAVHLANLAWIIGDGDRNITCTAEHLFQQGGMGFLIVNNQNTCFQNIGGTDHGIFSRLEGLAVFSANSSAAFSVSMNSLTLMGLVR